MLLLADVISLGLIFRHLVEKRSYGKSYKPHNLYSRAVLIWRLSCVHKEDVFITFVWYEISVQYIGQTHLPSKTFSITFLARSAGSTVFETSKSVLGLLTKANIKTGIPFFSMA